MIVAKTESFSSQILQGAPTGTYNFPSGPKAINFQPWCVLLGYWSVIKTAVGGFANWSSILSYLNILSTVATYKLPSLKDIVLIYSEPKSVIDLLKTVI